MSFLGRFVTSTKHWSLQLRGDKFALKVGNAIHVGAITQLENPSVVPGVLWSRVEVTGSSGQVMALDGISNRLARHMGRALASAIAHKRKVDKFIGDFEVAMVQVKVWVFDAQRASTEQLQRCGWLTHELKDVIEARKPRGLGNLLSIPGVSQKLATSDDDTQAAVEYWRASFSGYADTLNKKHLSNELVLPHKCSCERSCKVNRFWRYSTRRTDTVHTAFL